MRGVFNLKTSNRETKVSAHTLRSHTESVFRGRTQSNEYKFGSFGNDIVGSFGDANDQITHSNRSHLRQQMID